MKSPTSAPAPRVLPAPETTIQEEWRMIFDGRVDLSLTFDSEQMIDEYIDRGVELGQNRARYGKAVRHKITTTTAWRGVR